MSRSSRSRHLFAWVSLAALAGACTDATPPPVAPTVAIPEVPAVPAPSSLPDVVGDLATLVPGDAEVVVELPSIDKLGDLVPADQRASIGLVRPFLEGGVADKIGLDSRVLHDLVDGFDRATLFGDATFAVAIVRVRAAAGVEKLLASLKPLGDETVPGSRSAYQPSAAPGQRVVWYPRPRILVWATSREAAERVDRAANGSTSFAKNSRRLPDNSSALRVYADLGALVAKDAAASKIIERGSSLRAEIVFDAKGASSRADFVLVGERIPRLGAVFDPVRSTIADRAPSETVAFGSLSLNRKQGRTLRDLVVEIARAVDSRALPSVADALLKGKIGLGLDDLEAMLGGEIGFGVAVAPGAHIETSSPNKSLEDLVAFVEAPVRDDARAKKLVASIGAVLGKDPPRDYKVATTGAGVRLTSTIAGTPPMRLEAHKGAILYLIGGSKWMDRAERAYDRKERTLGGSPIYAESAASVEKPANGVVWIDVARATQAFAAHATTGAASKAAVGRALFGPSDRGLEIRFEGENGAETSLVGANAAVAIFAVERYLKAAKAAEAKNTIGAISRGAVAAFERETSTTPTHALCKSAIPVPNKVPAGGKYAPSQAANADFNTGDDSHGWRCLRFSMTSPHYYRYEYRQGGPYKGPARGGPDPGPNGFEVSAEGDLDGNGKTSLFTRIGTIDPKTQRIRLSPELFVVDEFE